MMLATFSSGLEEQMELEGRIIAQRAESADGREGVDAFLAKQHEQQGLAPQPEASRALLLRRLYMDLIGLDRKNVIGFTMPGFATSESTKANAWALMNALGVTGAWAAVAGVCGRLASFARLRACRRRSARLSRTRPLPLTIPRS